MPAKRKSKVPLFRKAMAAVDAAAREGAKPPGWARATTIQVRVPSRPGVLLDLGADRVTHLPPPAPGQSKTLSLCPTCDRPTCEPDDEAPPPCPRGAACPMVHALVRGAHEIAPHERAVASAMQHVSPPGSAETAAVDQRDGLSHDPVLPVVAVAYSGDESAAELSPAALGALAWLYERFPSGTAAVPVAAAGNEAATEMVPPDHMLRTRALESDRRPVSHCAHFVDKGRCDRGPECRFVHAVPLFLASLRIPPERGAPPTSDVSSAGPAHRASPAATAAQRERDRSDREIRAGSPLRGHISPLARAMSEGGGATAPPVGAAAACGAPQATTVSPTSFLYGRRGDHGVAGIAGALVAPQAAGGDGGGGGGVFDAVSHSADSVEVFVDADVDRQPHHDHPPHPHNSTDDLNTSLGAASPAVSGGGLSPSHRQAPQWKLPAAYAMRHGADVELPQLPDELLDAVTPPESTMAPSAFASPRRAAQGQEGQQQRAPIRQLGSHVSSGAVSPLSSGAGSAVRCHRPYDAAPVRVEGVLTAASPSAPGAAASGAP